MKIKGAKNEILAFLVTMKRYQYGDDVKFFLAPASQCTIENTVNALLVDSLHVYESYLWSAI